MSAPLPPRENIVDAVSVLRTVTKRGLRALALLSISMVAFVFAYRYRFGEDGNKGDVDHATHEEDRDNRAAELIKELEEQGWDTTSEKVPSRSLFSLISHSLIFIQPAHTFS